MGFCVSKRNEGTLSEDLALMGSKNCVNKRSYSEILADLAGQVAKYEFEEINRCRAEAGLDVDTSRAAMKARLIWSVSMASAGPDPDDSE